jgi:hypothetical protein
VKSVQLGKEVLSLRRCCLGTRSIHEKHLLRLENVVSANLIIQLHCQSVLKAKQTSKLTDSDLLLPPVGHPHKLLCIGIKVKSGIELTDDVIVPIVFEAHCLCHLNLITSCSDLLKIV